MHLDTFIVNSKMDRIFIRILIPTAILINNSVNKINAFRVFDVNGAQTILALENESINIVCKTGMPMTYCGFIHPSGKRYSFTGSSLIDGQCAVKIRATKNDTGDWKCHIGVNDVGVEIEQDINVRVVKKLAAIEPNITARHGKDVILSCVTTQGKTPLKYCRFEPPTGNPFSIDSGVTEKHPILGKYYYPQNKSLDRGDCAVAIHKVKYTDVGLWTCGAGLDDGEEHTDVIRVDVEGLYTMSTASSTGVTFGAIGVLIFLIILGVIVWKKRRFMGTREREPDAIEIQELPRAETPAAQGFPRPDSPGSQRSQLSHTLQSERILPMVVVQSPSEAGSSPLIK